MNFEKKQPCDVQEHRNASAHKRAANRLYKDRLFKRIFQDKKELLALYNAVNHSSYDNPDALEITTLEDVLYLSMKNDLSFLIGSDMNYPRHFLWNVLP